MNSKGSRCSYFARRYRNLSAVALAKEEEASTGFVKKPIDFVSAVGCLITMGSYNEFPTARTINLLSFFELF
jgi:hypothetical protein